MAIKIKNFKFTSRKVLRAALVIVGVLTLAATGLFITNEKNIHDTIADIIVLLVGAIALTMAVLTESEMGKQQAQTQKIHKEIMLALEEIREINKDNEYLKRKMREDLKIDKEISGKIDEISLNGLKN